MKSLEKFLISIRTEKYQSGVMTSARNQAFCRKYIISIGCFIGKELNPRNIKGRNISLLIQNNVFGSIWKSQGVGFNKAIEDDLKQNFKVVDNVTSDKQFKNLLKKNTNLKKFNLQKLF